jgi:hypothetical protein
VVTCSYPLRQQPGTQRDKQTQSTKDSLVSTACSQPTKVIAVQPLGGTGTKHTGTASAMHCCMANIMRAKGIVRMQYEHGSVHVHTCK